MLAATNGKLTALQAGKLKGELAKLLASLKKHDVVLTASYNHIQLIHVDGRRKTVIESISTTD